MEISEDVHKEVLENDHQGSVQFPRQFCHLCNSWEAEYPDREAETLKGSQTSLSRCLTLTATRQSESVSKSPRPKAQYLKPPSIWFVPCLVLYGTAFDEAECPHAG